MFPNRRISVLGGDKFKDDYSLAFDGTDDFVAIDSFAQQAIIAEDGAWTLAMWFKCEKITDGSQASEIVFSINGLSTTARANIMRIGINPDFDGNVKGGIFYQDSRTDDIANMCLTDSDDPDTGTSYNDAQWHHLVIRRDSGSGFQPSACFVDGNLQSYAWDATNGSAWNDGSSGNNVFTSDPKWGDAVLASIGQEWDAESGGYAVDSDFFTGKISEVAIYNTAVSLENIKRIINNREPYNHKEGVANTNLKAWWRMGDGNLEKFPGGNHPSGVVADMSGDSYLHYANKVTNSSFTDNATGWTLGSGWAYDDNNVTCSANNNNLSQDISAVAGETYKVKVSITAYTSGTLICDLGGSEDIRLIFDQSTNNNMVGYLTALNTNDLRFYGGAFRGTIDNITVYKVFGTPGIMMNMSQSNYTGDTP